MLIDFREGAREEDRVGEKHWCEKHWSHPPVCALTRNWTCNLGMCPDQGLNSRPSGLWNDTQTHWVTQDRVKALKKFFFRICAMAFIKPRVCPKPIVVSNWNHEGMNSNMSGHVPGIWDAAFMCPTLWWPYWIESFLQWHFLCFLPTAEQWASGNHPWWSGLIS